jgi:deoxyribose-phosphate aldolase
MTETANKTILRIETMKLSRSELASMIDHTLVRPTAIKDEIIKLCWEAEKHGFCSVVVNSAFVPLARYMLEATEVKVCSTVGFPIGVVLPEVKAFEARKAVELGAEETDMVMNTSALKSKDYETVKQDIEGVLGVKHSNPNIIAKVIIETGLLTDKEKIIACKLSKEAGADFVKTSTGLIAGEATVKDVKLMRKTVGKDMGVKAAGGIRTLEQALAMIEAGANRIGTSAAVKIIEEMPKKQ